MARSARHSGISVCFTPGCNSTQADAAKIKAKPMMSATLSLSPSRTAEAVTPTTGVISEPSDAVIAGSRPTIDHHRKCATPTPNMPT